MDNVLTPVNVKSRIDLGLKVGDTVRVHQKVVENNKTRIQIFEGLVIARKHGNESGGTFTVRRVTGGFGVEKIFPIYSPMIDKIEIAKRSKTRRAKLYYLRDKVARQIRQKLRKMIVFSRETVSEDQEKKKVEEKVVESETKVEEKVENEVKVEVEEKKVEEKVVENETKVEKEIPKVESEVKTEDRRNKSRRKGRRRRRKNKPGWRNW